MVCLAEHLACLEACSRIERSSAVDPSLMLKAWASLHRHSHVHRLGPRSGKITAKWQATCKPFLCRDALVPQSIAFCDPFHPHATKSRQPTDKMAWRNQGITGSNNIPLGKRRFADGEEDGFNHGSASPSGFANGPSNGSSNGDRDVKRGRSPERASST
jgi:hypothetical protein